MSCSASGADSSEQCHTALSHSPSPPVLPAWPEGRGTVRGVGLDLVDVKEFDVQVHLPGTTFLRQAFTPAERRYCAGRSERLAARWAAKEAFIKAWSQAYGGPPLIDADAVRWSEIEIVSSRHGVPSLRLSGEISRQVTISCSEVSWLVSMSHDGNWASAIVVAYDSTIPH
ncbi:holo-ACP synthase [Actinomyces vulturis]|uniref:holo-ACP synthase n=1 Tax=Actinomyces vulturis TaxID=1857645 RepID=UPI0009F182D0